MAGALDKVDLELKKKIASRLQELRKESGKNQTDFAYDFGTDKQTWNRLEGGRGATIYTINKVCKLIGMSLSEFFDSPIFKDSKLK